MTLGILGISLLATPSYAKKAGLSPAKVRQAKIERKSYENCRKEAVGQLKQGAINKRTFETALTSCKENFPGASLYIACKKSAIRTARSKAIAEEDAAAQCKRYLTATAFDPKDPLPFFVEAGQLFFAGIGLNKSQPTASLAPPNFDCSRLEAAVAQPKADQYLLFGNHPRVFAGLADRQGRQLQDILGMKPTKKTRKGRKTKATSKNGFDVPGFGRVFGDPKSAGSVVYFASAPCDFEAALGDLYSGLTAYYLLDHASNSVSPYFGIAYFKGDQTEVTTTALTQSLIRSLGNSYKAVAKNRQVTFVAEQAVVEIDDEQDPKNLCREPRNHRFVGVVQGQKNAPGRPEYLILANVKNLCEFGDRLGRRLVE